MGMDYAERAVRNQNIYALYVKGETQNSLAAKYGLSQPQISEIVKEERNKIPADERAEMIKDSISLLRLVKKMTMEVAEMVGAPVTAGKDGFIVIDPETGGVVRDYAARMKALSLAVNVDDAMAKRLGLDAATKTESTDTVKWILEGVDVEDLK